MKVLSLFDGISCGRVALERTGYAVSAYAAFEIDKYARAISRYNFPDIEHCGDVLDADFSKFTGYDLVIGGSPCTFWSIAKNNREVDKSGTGWKLFMRFVDAVQQISPRYFLYENVASMPANIKAYISEELGCEPVLINSALLSAQHRKRLYWTNIKGITQPEDRGILLQDILETGITALDKSRCIDACYYKGGSKYRLNNQSGKRLMAFEPIALTDKSQTILSTMFKENEKSMIMRQKVSFLVAMPQNKTHEDCAVAMKASASAGAEVGAALRTRADMSGKFKRLEVRDDGKLNAMTTVQTDSVVCFPVRVGEIGSGGVGSRIYSVQGKTVALMGNGGGSGAKTGLYKINLPDGDYSIRKLTVTEAERCQTLDGGYTAFGVDDTGNTVKISNTQRYRGIGNGWTIDVIAHIFSHMDTGKGDAA